MEKIKQLESQLEASEKLALEIVKELPDTCAPSLRGRISASREMLVTLKREVEQAAKKETKAK